MKRTKNVSGPSPNLLWARCGFDAVRLTAFRGGLDRLRLPSLDLQLVSLRDFYVVCTAHFLSKSTGPPWRLPSRLSDLASRVGGSMGKLSPTLVGIGGLPICR